jgi:GNAT superfamily N-acetyltransferase
MVQADPVQGAAAFAEWFGIWRVTDLEKFPDEPSWDEDDVRAMTNDQRSTETHLLLVRQEGGIPVGAAMLNLPQLDNLHASWLDVRVHPDHRRQGVGRFLVDEVSALVLADGRRVVNGISDMPVAQEAFHPSTPFARAMGFVASHAGHRRSLSLPMQESHLQTLRTDVAEATGADAYRILTFRGLWPAEFIADECALERAMSTDQPLGDQDAEEEVWDEARILELDQQLTAQGMVSLVSAAQHIASGHLVAYSRIAVAARRPTEAWQWATIVLKEHRGHRLGLAVKLANLDFLARELPTARHVITSNAAVNGPMIAVNDLMGFEVDAVGAFWQKSLHRS